MDSLERSYTTDPNHSTLSQIEDVGSQIFKREQAQKIASKKENPPQSSIIEEKDKSEPESKKKTTPISSIIAFFSNLLKKFLSPLKKQAKNNPSVAPDPKFLCHETQHQTDPSSSILKHAKSPVSLSHQDTTKPNTKPNSHHQHP